MSIQLSEVWQIPEPAGSVLVLQLTTYFRDSAPGIVVVSSAKTDREVYMCVEVNNDAITPYVYNHIDQEVGKARGKRLEYATVVTMLLAAVFFRNLLPEQLTKLLKEEGYGQPQSH